MKTSASAIPGLELEGSSQLIVYFCVEFLEAVTGAAFAPVDFNEEVMVMVDAPPGDTNLCAYLYSSSTV